MRNLIRNSIILLVAVLIAVWAIVPPDKKLRKGKDLAGGASLVYQVTIRPGETDVMSKAIEVIKRRIDPNGVMEISVVAQGQDRIEITMPLPSGSVKKLKDEFEQTLKAFSAASLTPERFDAIAARPAADRAAQVAALSGGDRDREDKFNAALAMYDQLQVDKGKLAEAEAQVRAISAQIADQTSRGESADGPVMQGLNAALAAAKEKLTPLVNAAAPSELAYEAARESAITTGMTAREVQDALRKPTETLTLSDKSGKVVKRPSAREAALESLRKKFPADVEKLEKSIAAWNKYEQDRRTLDDPSDLIRMMKGAGVLNFRIAVDSGSYPGEQEAREQLIAGGPRSLKNPEVRWFKINKIDGWVNSVESLEALNTKGSAEYFRGYGGYIVDDYNGESYMLCWDTPGMRLTEADGEDWALSGATPSADQLGRQAIAFSMNPLGAVKLGALTENNVGRKMAVLLDDQVYTAPTLQSRISSSGQITGSFSQAEIDYVIRVLSAGSFKAKLSEDPISQSVLGPELGADNLDRGLRAGIISFIVVAGFMVSYYFGSGFIAVIGLGFNALFLLALMSLNHAAFTLPGIAGVILAFGMAVDANVLIYERLREEFSHGHDLRTAVRLAYSRAMAPIVDGNLTHLITCLVLGFFGTQEIKGFAVTMSIGVLTTLFCQLFITRLIYTFLIEKVRIRKMNMLPMAVPSLQRAMSPSIDWMRLSPFFYSLSALAVIASIALIFSRGGKLLDTEFLGGTKVTVQFSQGQKMTRAAVEEAIRTLAPNDQKDPLAGLAQAEVLAINPEQDGVTSGTFTIKSTVVDAKGMLATISKAFQGKLNQVDAVNFDGNDIKNSSPPVFPITSANIGEVIDQPGIKLNAPEFLGGAAIVLDNLGPAAPTLQDLQDRIDFMKNDPQFTDASGREHQVYALKNSPSDPDRVTSAVILVRDPSVNYINEPARWTNDLRPSEWRLTVEAMNRSSSAAAVQNFSPSVASDFAQTAVVAIALSAVLILIYVGVRFNSVRYSAGALIATLHDCVVAVGMIAVADMLAGTPSLQGFAATLGILPFKIDLNVIAAVLTILGYSLNDKIVVMDRIRENRGKLPFASKRIINLSINQTISRTIMTGMTTFLASLVLYIWGGEAIRAFAYCFLVGVVVGTYSSVAVAAPFVWSRKIDKDEDAHPSPAGAAVARA